MSEEFKTVKKGPDASEPYIHHANSLFHFVKKPEFVYDIFEREVIFPRYFVEDISYLSIVDEDKVEYNKAAILGLCFCDIPLSQICFKEDITYLDDVVPKDVQKHNMDHTEIYGEYAVGFSKDWGIQNGIKPIHYEVRENTYLSEAFLELHKEDDAPDSLTSFVLDYIGYSKPVNGQMIRIKTSDGKEPTAYKIKKNFYNEQEWRYIPTEEACRIISEALDNPVKPINASKFFLDDEYEGAKNKFHELSDRISRLNNNVIGLKVGASDIQYIIVPNDNARGEMINQIERIYGDKLDRLSISVLISKIHLLADIRRDY